MSRVTPEGRWIAPAGQFAARIRASDLPGVFSKDLLVDFGTRAVLVEDGEIVGELPPGTYTLDSLAERLSFEPPRPATVVVVREEEIPIEIAETTLNTRDGRAIRAGLRANVRADDATCFLENVFGARESLALDELRSVLTPVLAEQLRDAVGRMTLKELVQADAHRRLADAAREAGETLCHYGFQLGPVLTVSIRQTEQAGEPTVAPETTNEIQSPLDPPHRRRKSGRRTIRGPETTAVDAGQGRKPTRAMQEPAPVSRQGNDPEPTAAARSILINSFGMRLALIPPGSFLMGSPPGEPGRSGAEDQHRVEIAQPFYLGIFLVTQEEYRNLMGTDPSCFAEPEPSEIAAGMQGELPVERVSWEDACEFCRRLSESPAEKATGRRYRLPTEAEWEYACRAGTASAFASGESFSPAEANFDGRTSHGGSGAPSFRGSTTPVGCFPPNPWGLYDMHGNLFEWCADWFSPDYYRQSPPRDPAGPATGFARVLRGGSWRSRAEQCRSAARYSATPTHRHDAFGFRVACITG